MMYCIICDAESISECVCLEHAKETERWCARALREAMSDTVIMPSNNVEKPLAAYDAARARVDELEKQDA